MDRKESGKRKVLLIFGGCSTEYTVSLNSASAVAEAVDREKYEILYLGITRDGRALYFEGEPTVIADDTWQKCACFEASISMSRGTPALWVDRGGRLEKIFFDIAFPVLHGKNGEDGTLQGLLELAGIPIAGCGAESSAVGMDKNLAHMLAAVAGVSVPGGVLLKSAEEYYEKRREIAGLGLPVFVKPVRSGSSFGISRVTDAEQMRNAVREAFSHDGEVLIEEEIQGFEVGCAVMGNDRLTIGRADEIELLPDKETGTGFFDYEEKYSLKASAIHMPARVAAEDEERIRDTAGVIYRALGCRGFARVDMFFTKDKRIVFNEVNTIPGFTNHSRFPNMMKGIGLEFAQVVDAILALAAGEDDGR